MNTTSSIIALCGFLGFASLAQAQLIAPSAPPPAETEVVPVPPASTDVWVAGHWAWNGAGWNWEAGHYVAQPAPQEVWVPGQWKQYGLGWVWSPGHWAAQ